MPCLEKVDLTKLAEQHITSQKAIVKNLRSRKDELIDEERILAAQAPDSERHKQVRGAIAHLRKELDGEVETEPGSFTFVRDRNKKTAEERAEIIAAQYLQREHFVFRDTTKKEGKERVASVFGLPTVSEMQRLNNKEISEEIMTRSISLVANKQSNRNPVDFIDSEGLEVKTPLGKAVEHHHIYNNVHLDSDGNVTPKSFNIRYNSQSQELEFNVIPSYWNADEHGKNTQFIGLLDGMHAGDDPITHLHYYKFNKKQAKEIEDKIRSDIPEKIDKAKERSLKLESTLSDLRRREKDPDKYEQDLLAKIGQTESELVKTKANAKGLLSKTKSTLSGEDLSKREAHDQKKSELNKLNKELKENKEISTIRDDIAKDEVKISGLSSQIKAINLRSLPKGDERDKARGDRRQLQDDLARAQTAAAQRIKLLKSKGDISEQIRNTERKLAQEQAIANLSPDDAVGLFNRSNGFLSFDKGLAEKTDHTIYRPLMNEEISHYYVRETLGYLEREYGNNALPVLQQMVRNQYKNNLLQRLEATYDKVKDNADIPTKTQA